jgi:hypothetical protein
MWLMWRKKGDVDNLNGAVNTTEPVESKAN